MVPLARIWPGFSGGGAALFSTTFGCALGSAAARAVTGAVRLHPPSATTTERYTPARIIAVSLLDAGQCHFVYRLL